MKEYTKDNPGCYHSMISYMSELSGIPVYKDEDIGDIGDIKSFNHTIHYVLHGEELGQLKPIYRKGGIRMLTDCMTQQLNIPFDMKFDRIYQVIRRKRDEFGVPFTKVGKYKDSLGGGWYQHVDLYQINDKFFADMDCTCG